MKTRHPKRPTRLLVPGFFLLVQATAVLSGATGWAGAAESDGSQALEKAFRFASAIDADPKDRARAQQGVVQDYAKIDAIEVGVEKAALIEGWRRGMAYVSLAVELAKRGEEERARELIGLAEGVRQRTEGFGGPRISSYIARALAYLGELPESRKLSEALAEADVQQYAGQAAATIALAHAVRGEFDVAMATMEGLANHTDIYLSWWRVAGYVDIARLDDLTETQRRAALDAGYSATEQVPGWKRAESLFLVADAYRDLDLKKRSRQALRKAEEIVDPLPNDLAMKAPMLSALARGWARLGKKKDAERVLAAAEYSATATRKLDRPSVLAYIASGYAELGDAERTMELYDEALTTAESLVNSRPRALAIVNVCRAMGRSRIAPDDSTIAHLDALYAGLGDPW
jgi:tetratricopeptide (TPR) repeat protein